MTKINKKASYLLVKVQILTSALFVLSSNAINVPHHKVESLIYGLLVVMGYVSIFQWTLIRILRKKTIALAALTIVFKWSILWLIIKEFMNNPLKDYSYFGIGLSSVVVTTVFYMILLNYFEERV
jgi:hypothetical protein